MFPGRDCSLERGFVGETMVEALLLQDAQLDLGHMQPAPVLGCAMQRQLPGNPPRLSRLKRFIQRRDLLRIAMVQHDPHPRGFGGAFVHQPLHRVGEVDLRSLLRPLHLPPAGLRFHEEKKVTRAVALVGIIIALRPPWLRRQREPGLFHELLGGLINVDLGPGGILRLGVDLQDVFHGGDALRTHLWAAPWLLQPRLEDRFFQTRRTLS